MSESPLNKFIELEDYWRSITRRDYFPRGFGKWMLYSEEPHRLYQILREGLISGALKDASSIKTRVDRPAGEVGGVFIYTAPYTDQERALRLAEELRELDGVHQFQLVGSLLYITDLHNTWAETISRPGDGFHELLKKQNWIYKYQDGELVTNAAIQALHQAMENPPENADPEFAIIRSLLPEEIFASPDIHKD